jgi:hypothetical protein
MLATNPVDPDMTFRFQSLSTVGAHTHVDRRGERGLGGGAGLLGAAALLVIGYIVGGVAASSTSGPVADAPRPVDIGGGTAKVAPLPRAVRPVPGEFRLGPGNDPAPGIVVAVPEPAAGDFRLGPGNEMPPGVTAR